MTPLDTAHREMAAQPDDPKARLWFYETLLASELFIPLTEEPADNSTIKPDIFETEGHRFVLGFDTEARLAEFAGAPVPFAGLSGRALFEMIMGQDLGLGLNLAVAPSAELLGPQAVSWAASLLAENQVNEAEARLLEIHPPHGLPEALITSLDRKLAAMAGMADLAYLADALRENAGRGVVLAFVNALPAAQGAMAAAIQEALVFSGLEAGSLDVIFLDESDDIAASFARHGLKFELPKVAQPQPLAAPGMDPDKPPKL